MNPKNVSRAAVFDHLLLKHNLVKVDLHHPTYHHFLGQGEFDSPLDAILHVKRAPVCEVVKTIICKLQHPLIESHHDLIVSTFSLPICNKIEDENQKISAPRVDNDRLKILLSEEGIENYESVVSDHFSRLRSTWCDPSSPALMSILLSSTYSLLSSAASSTNKAISLGSARSPKPRCHPHIVAAQKDLLSKHENLKRIKSSPAPDLLQDPLTGRQSELSREMIVLLEIRNCCLWDPPALATYSEQ